MAPRKKFDKKNATTFALLHRGHDDEKFFDNDASRRVLVPIEKKQKNKIRTKDELEQELNADVTKIRENEGEAAQYGIYYDDTDYDYMQHLKPMGQSTDAVFISKTETKTEKPKPSNKQLMEMLKDSLPSENKRNITQADLENIPRELQGFKPDMDPRLRETLEALEDEAFIDEGEGNVEDFFNDILQSGEAGEDFSEEGDFDQWDMDNYDDEYATMDEAGYDTEDIEDRQNQTPTSHRVDDLDERDKPYNEGEAPEDSNGDASVINNGWEKHFEQFKKTNKYSDDSDNEFDDEEDVMLEKDELPDLPSIDTKKQSKTKLRKKKGAMTDVTSFSMTSSAVYRTDGLTLLDDRFEKLAKDFEKEEDEQEHYSEFKMEEQRGDFESLLDDFLDNYELDTSGRKIIKKNEEVDRLKAAADKASNTKVSRRRKEKESLSKGFGNLRI